MWSRLDGLTSDELAGLLTERKAVRVVLMRGTIHLVTAEDRKRLFSAQWPYLSGQVLVDGYVAGTWEP